MIDFVKLSLDQAGTRGYLGLLVMGQIQQQQTDGFKEAKKSLEAQLRNDYENMTRGELKALHPLSVYTAYYRKFGYTYHVLGQLESVIKGKPLPEGPPLVDVMFMAELKNLLLTAAHDWSKVKPPVTLAHSSGDEVFTTLSGREVSTITGDLMISDGEGVISSILRGPDQRTCVDAHTQEVVYTVYGLPGIEESLIWQNLQDMEAGVRMFAPAAARVFSQVVST